MRLILKMPMDAHKTENLCFDFLTEIPQGWLWISRSLHKSNMMKPGSMNVETEEK
jgi:hypothetical protein